MLSNFLVSFDLSLFVDSALMSFTISFISSKSDLRKWCWGFFVRILITIRQVLNCYGVKLWVLIVFISQGFTSCERKNAFVFCLLTSSDMITTWVLLNFSFALTQKKQKKIFMLYYCFFVFMNLRFHCLKIKNAKTTSKRRSAALAVRLSGSTRGLLQLCFIVVFYSFYLGAK